MSSPSCPSPCIPAHRAEPLMHNHTYLSSIQRHSVSLYYLGFHDLSLSSVQHSVGDSTLKPVIPKDNQIDFLDNIDKGIQYMTKHRRRKPKYNNFFTKESQNIPLRHPSGEAKEDRPVSPTSKINPFSLGITPHYAQLGEKAAAIQQAEIEAEAERRRKEEHFHKIAQHYDLIKDGVKYSYNPLNGQLQPADEIPERVRSALQRKKQFIESSIDPLPSFHPMTNITEEVLYTGEIAEKASRYVKHLRESIAKVITLRSMQYMCVTYCFDVSTLGTPSKTVASGPRKFVQLAERATTHIPRVLSTGGGRRLPDHRALPPLQPARRLHTS
jgi:hypothetical protein